MTAELMDAILADATPRELTQLLKALPFYRRVGLTQAEADEWRRRIVALIAFHGTGFSDGAT